MICYRDKTFCQSSDECKNTKCWRYLSEEAKKDSGEIGLPICFADFKNDEGYCEGFIPKEDTK